MAEARKLLAEFAELLIPGRNTFTSSWGAFLGRMQKAEVQELQELHRFGFSKLFRPRNEGPIAGDLAMLDRPPRVGQACDMGGERANACHGGGGEPGRRTAGVWGQP